MAFSFTKKAPAKTVDPEPVKTIKPAMSATPKPAPSSQSAKFSFLKKGASAKKAMAEDEARAEQAKQDRDKLWRFWLPEDGERQITFLDGPLDSDGMLDIYMFREHAVRINGNIKHYICTAESEGTCPICDEGESKAALVGVMTIIDHTPYEVKSGANAGKTIKNSRKLFVAKQMTVKLLSKIAAKRGGLAGATFDVLRTGDKSAAVGSQFDFVEKRTLPQVAAAYGMKLEDVQPADLTHELTYLSAAELVELGLGKAPSGVGYEKGVKDGKDLAGEL